MIDVEADKLPTAAALAVIGPVETEAEVTAPAVLNEEPVMEPLVLSDVAVISTAESEPESDTVAAVMLPAVDNEDEVTGPEVVRPAVPKMAALALNVPLTVSCVAVAAPATETDAADNDPEVVIPDEPMSADTALRVPETVRWVPVSVPVDDTAVTVMGRDDVNPATETTPEALRLVEVRGPIAALALVMADAVTDPDVETEAACKPPVTDALLATRAPRAETVRVAEPSTTEAADGPSLTAPFEPPVPASKTISPPVEPEWPDG